MKYLPACLVLAATAFGATPPTPVLVWETSGFFGPKSVVFDADRNEYYVSNMGSHGPHSAPADGFISRVSAEGKILELKWAWGFDNPKGLAITNGRLYVADDAALVAIDLTTHKGGTTHKGAYYPGPDGLPPYYNDVTADEAGNVYVCSGRTNVVYRLRGRTMTLVVDLDESKAGRTITGLKAEKDRLLLGCLSMPSGKGRDQPGHISTVAYKGKAMGRIGEQPLCHIDGLESDGQDGYTVTDWLKGDVLHVTADGKTTPLLQLGRGTADHAYLADHQLLVIPQMLEHKVRAYRWAP